MTKEDQSQRLFRPQRTCCGLSPIEVCPGQLRCLTLAQIESGREIKNH